MFLKLVILHHCQLQKEDFLVVVFYYLWNYCLLLLLKGHFSKVNEILRKIGKEEIDWNLPA